MLRVLHALEMSGGMHDSLSIVSVAGLRLFAFRLSLTIPNTLVAINHTSSSLGTLAANQSLCGPVFFPLRKTRPPVTCARNREIAHPLDAICIGRVHTENHSNILPDTESLHALPRSLTKSCPKVVSKTRLETSDTPHTQFPFGSLTRAESHQGFSPTTRRACLR